VLPFLDPLPAFQISQPANVLRIFERGGRFAAETGLPEPLEEPGRPRTRVSIRGPGTQNRTDPVVIGLHKTRLHDPTLNFLGTNDQPGDYRSSGCTSCHMVYANDRSEIHAGPYAKYGNRGLAAAETDDFVLAVDPMIRKDEPGHPVAHRFARGNGVPTSQCMVCHVHPGTTVMNSYLGYMWWDEETDAELIYPAEQAYPTSEEVIQTQMRNPNESAARSRLADPEFVANLTDLNSQTRHTQFADFHSHGWAFRAVFKRDREGNLVDHRGEPVTDDSNQALQAAVKLPALLKEPYRNADQKSPQQICQAEQALTKSRDGKPVHLLDIHVEKGMHCVDCHFVQDVHGNTKLQGEVRAAIEIQCIDCHGTTTARTTLHTSGPAAYTSNPNDPSRGRSLAALRTPSGKRRFEQRGDKIIQNSMVEENLSWEVTQVADTIDPRSPDYNALSALAKTIRFKDDSRTEYVWGDLPKGDKKCAHALDNMSCIACHSSWNPSCYGCHLPQKANRKMPSLHFEGDVTRNHVSYNFQTLRDEVYMLARDGIVTGNRIGPARSSCAIQVSSYNLNRDAIYMQQQTVSAEGLSGIAFSTNVPHTVRGKGGTKLCTDCHVSQANDNNALLAQLLMQGTNYLNFIGRYCWVGAGERGLYAVNVTELEEPQAVIGSTLHQTAFPDYYHKHVKRQFQLQTAHRHVGTDVADTLAHPFRKAEILGVQLRGEYVYAACGEAGVRIFDAAFIDDKSFSQRVTSAPVSPLGQKFFVKTKYATAVAAPVTTAVDPLRTQNPENRETKIHPLFGYLYVTDKYEGLILIGVGTTLDGIPTNNFLKRDVTFNPDGILCGASALTIVGTYAYVCCDAGLVVVSLEDPQQPYVTTVLGGEFLHQPRSVQVQFRYGFLCDAEGVKVIDTTHPSHPTPVTALQLPDARSIYVARTYAYVAGGASGLVILDVKNPAEPKIDQIYTADGCINDLCDVKLGITYVSEFAYLADGQNGLRVVQLTSPDTPGNPGFSPRPAPSLIATYPIPRGGRALAVSEGLDRDRAVDESGNQSSVFGRLGARPFNLSEQQRMYLRPDGSVWNVIDQADAKFYGPRAPFSAPREARRVREKAVR
jgi:hypothetical protein